MKPLFWVGSSLNDLRAFPEEARRIAGHQLHLVQQALEPDDWKPMASVGARVYEIRIHTAVEHRVFYVGVQLARDRYQEVLKHRQTLDRLPRR